jgi:hypothetical protein
MELFGKKEDEALVDTTKDSSPDSLQKKGINRNTYPIEESVAVNSSTKHKEKIPKFNKKNMSVLKINVLVLGFFKELIALESQANTREAQKEASELFSTLYSAHVQFTRDLEVHSILQAKDKFLEIWDTAIVKAKPVLERDLSLGEYLSNILINIYNAFAQYFTDNPQRFFTPIQSKPIQAIMKTRQSITEVGYEGIAELSDPYKICTGNLSS